MSDHKNLVRVFVHYDGRVQGVGFRYSVCAIADRYDVTGYVKNLRDGRVELCAEGESETVVSFLNEVENGHLKRYILNINKNWSECKNEFTEFGIKY